MNLEQYKKQIKELMKADRPLTHQENVLLDYCNYVVRSYDNN